MLTGFGVTAMETRAALVTVSEVDPLMEPEVAVIVTVPVPVLMASPNVLTEATLMFEEDQVTDESCCVLPSSKIPVAVNCSAVPRAMEGVAGVSEIERS
jgi:hypothetical protein